MRVLSRVENHWYSVIAVEMERNVQIWAVYRVDSRALDGGLDVEKERKRGDKKYF